MGRPASCTSFWPSHSAWPALLPLVPRDWLAQPTTKAKAQLTFGVQEVQGSSHILYHAAGLSLVEVLPLLDVGQDGAWEAEERREMPSQALLSITCQRPSVRRFGWGAGLFMAECPAPSVVPGTEEVLAQNCTD